MTLATALTLLGWLIAAPLAAILAYFTLELVLGLKPLNSKGRNATPQPRTTVLIPAHNEGLLVAGTVRHLLETSENLSEQLFVLVVADNCSDDTAPSARGSGAAVIERRDPDNRGKGFALAFGRDHLATLPEAERPEAVIVIDADCRMSATSALYLAAEADRLNAPVQSRNLLVSGKDRSPLVEISNFAMLVKNLVRARGLNRLAGGIPLFGTGMGFPWPLFAKAALATDHVVEDMQLALHLADEKVKVQLVETALVESEAAGGSDMAAQRSRWEHGFLSTAIGHALPLIARGIARGSRHLIGLGLHLLVPPLALLVMLGFAGLAITLGTIFLGASMLPAATLAIALAVALTAVAAAWLLEGRQTLSIASALSAPLYVLWKIPLYLRFFTKRQTGWNRTRRQGEKSDDGA